MLSLAIDVEGGDVGTTLLVESVLDATVSVSLPIKLYLCGKKDIIEPVLERFASKQGEFVSIKIEHSPDNIEPEDIPARAWKSKENSSIIRAIALQAEGKVSATLSAGDTRILMGAALFILGRRDGIKRPALASFLPTVSGSELLLLDIGANLDCKGEQLADFAFLGSEHFSLQTGKVKPSVSLLNVGIERSKGTKEILHAASLLENSFRGYTGFIEGGDILSGESDVVVCDGFVGNILLKSFESFYQMAKVVVGRNSKILATLEKDMTILNRDNYGAAPLLGLNGTVFKAHGASSPGALKKAVNAVLAATLAKAEKNENERLD